MEMALHQNKLFKHWKRTSMDSQSFKKIAKNLSYMLVSNLLTMLISTVTILVLPKLIGVKDYGFWQLYYFYSGYVGFFHLGWIDGIYLKFAGKYYEELDKKALFSQFIALNLFLGISSLVVIGQSFFHEAETQFIFFAFACNIVLTNARAFFIFLLQTTNRIKASALITMSDRITYILMLVGLLLIGVRRYEVMVTADVLARFISLVYAMFVCKDIIRVPFKFVKFNFSEIIDNIKVGSNLMFSTIASMLIIGIVRFGIQNVWDIETFGKISLTLSISTLIMTFINAVGVVIFPILKRAKSEQLPILYRQMRTYLMVVIFAILFAYYPTYTILNAWLPAYRDKLIYMTLVFPMAVFESKMSLLVSSYLKALRMERAIFLANVLTMVVSLMMTVIVTGVMKNLELSILSIVILLAVKSAVAERFLSQKLSVDIVKDIVLESVVVLLFIVINWFMSMFVAILLYTAVYIGYCIVKGIAPHQLLKQIKQFRKSK